MSNGNAPDRNFFAKAWSSIKGFPHQLISNRIVLIITVVVILAAGFAVWRVKAASAAKSSSYVTATATTGNIQETISATGNIIAAQNVALTFKSQGYVQNSYVQLGDTVKAGQVLATEDPSDLQSALQQAQSQLATAQANYNKVAATEPQQIAQAQAQAAQAKTAMDNANNTLTEDQQLLAAGDASQSTVNADQSAYQQAEASYQTAQITLAQEETHADLKADAAAVQSAQSSVAEAQSNLNSASITAPFDGYIATIDGNPGMWTGGGAVASGTATATQFEIIMTSTELLIDAEVNEADISHVAVGQPVTFTVDTYPNSTFTGKITALSPNASTINNVQMYEARISIDNSSGLKSGMPANITIITAQASNVVLVPQTALTYGNTYQASAKSSGSSSKQTAVSTGSSTASSGAVVVLVGGQPQIKTVQTGLTDDVNVEIKSGLAKGDIVVTGSSGTASKSSSTSTSSSSSSAGGAGRTPGLF